MGFVSLILVLPMVADTYGLAGLGVYATLTSLTTFLAAVDSGMGSSARSVAIEASSEGPASVGRMLRSLRSDGRRWTAVAIACTTVLSLAIPWEDALGDIGGLGGDGGFGLVVAGFSALYLLGVLQQLNARVLEGLGRTGLAAALSVIGPTYTLLATAVACHASAPLALTVLLPAAAPLILGLAARFVLRQSGVEASRANERGFANINRRGLQVGVALPMLIISLSYAFSYSLDYWLVTALAGADATGGYAAAARPAQVFVVLASAASPVLWTHFARARHDGEHDWLAQGAILRISGAFLGAALISAAVYCAGLLLFGSALTAGLAQPSPALILAFAVWGVLLVAHQPFAMALNSAHELKLQLMSMLVATPVNVALSLWWIPLFGPEGAVWASCFALGVVHLPFLAWRVTRLSRALGNVPE